MVDQLPQQFHDLEDRVKDLYQLIPHLEIKGERCDELHCDKCQNILIRAYGVSCDHHFCGPCIKYMVARPNPKCHLDGISINPQKISHREQEKAIERQVAKVVVNCPNQGCKQSFPIIEIQEHYNTCPVNYGDKSKKNNVTKKHGQKNIEIEFSDFKTDLEEKLNSIHDNIKKLQKDGASHTSQITKLQRGQEKLDNTLEQVQKALSALESKKFTYSKTKINSESSQPGHLKWCISNYKKKKEESMYDAKKLMKSPEFTAYEGYTFRVDVLIKKNTSDDKFYLGVTLNLLSGVNDDDLRWPLTGKTIISLLSRSDDKWISNSIPFTFNRSVAKDRSVLCIPHFVKLEYLDKRISTEDSFQIEIVVTKN